MVSSSQVSDESVHSPQYKRKTCGSDIRGSHLYCYYNRAPNVLNSILQISHLFKISFTLASPLAPALFSTADVCQRVDCSMCFDEKIMAHHYH